MIIVTRLNGPGFALNPDLIERVETTPDSVITLVDGTKYVVAESLEQIIALVREFRASVIATATSFEPPHPVGLAHAHEPSRRREQPTQEPSAVIPLPLREV